MYINSTSRMAACENKARCLYVIMHIHGLILRGEIEGYIFSKIHFFRLFPREGTRLRWRYQIIAIYCV